MPAAELHASAWAEVRKASEAGMPDSELSKEYGVAKTAIRKRRQREAWLTPNRIAQEREIQKIKEQHRTTTSATRSHVSPGLSLVGKSLADYAESHPLRMVALIDSRIQEAVKNQSIPQIESWKSLATADQMMRRNLGLDKPEASVNVSVWGGTVETGGEREVGPVEVEGELLE